MPKVGRNEGLAMTLATHVRFIFEKLLLATFMTLWLQTGAHRKMFSSAVDPKSLFMLTVTNMYRLSIAQMLSDFTNPVGKILLLITQEQAGNCSSDVNGVLLDRHQYRREHNLAPWMLPTKAQLYYPVIWLWQPVSLNWCLTSSHRSQCEPLHWLKCFSVDPFGSQIGFQIRSPLPTWTETHILDGADLTAILSEDWPHFDWGSQGWRGGVRIRQPSEGCSGVKYSLFLYDLVMNRDATLLSISPTCPFNWRKIPVQMSLEILDII